MKTTERKEDEVKGRSGKRKRKKKNGIEIQRIKSKQSLEMNEVNGMDKIQQRRQEIK